MNSAWYSTAKTDEKRVLNLIHYLNRSKTGAKLLSLASQKASKHGETLTDMIQPGEVSITDTTLIRRFDRDNPLEMIYETKSKIIINQGLKFRDAILDLAHELTHYNYKEAFNPYQPQFTSAEFLRSTLEAKGGEIEAYLVECKVMAELYPTTSKENTNCHRIRDDEKNIFSKELATKLFYQLGPFHKMFEEELESLEIKKEQVYSYSNDEAHFISSAYGLPYPLAALREYQTIMTKVCQNDQKRLGLLRDSIGRTLASIQRSGNEKLYQKMHQSFQTRCPLFMKPQ